MSNTEQLRAAARLARDALTGYPFDDAHWRDFCSPAIKALEAALSESTHPADVSKSGAQIDMAASGQPVAHLWQHSETGRTRIVMPDQIITADANWCVIGPLYLGAAPQPAPALVPRWIPVTEQLPPKYTEVLVAFCGQVSLASTGQYTGNKHDTNGWCYPAENNGGCDDGSDPVVTHWMPLPEVPPHPNFAPAGITAKEAP